MFLKPDTGVSIHRLRVRRDDAPLLMHAIQMMNRADTMPNRMSMPDCGRNVGFGQQNGLRQPPPHRQMTGYRGGKSTTCAMRRVGPEPGRLEQFLLDSALAGKT